MKKALYYALIATILLTIVIAALYIRKQIMLENDLSVDIFEGFTALLLCILLIPIIIAEVGLFDGIMILVSHKNRNAKRMALGLTFVFSSIICLAIAIPQFLNTPLFGGYGVLYWVQIALITANTLLLVILLLHCFISNIRNGDS
ncbi:MAG: hypothetical protein K6G56_05685 [Clostridiales bacterium]|jgi:hypothetical protein|nr:hypothetical protein [Clostridiales bacterium]